MNTAELQAEANMIGINTEQKPEKRRRIWSQRYEFFRPVTLAHKKAFIDFSGHFVTSRGYTVR